MRRDDWASFDILDQETFPEDRVYKKAFERYLSTSGFYGLFSDAGGLIGYLKMNDHQDGKGHLGRIAVAKAHQRRGFGSQLMEYCLHWFRKHKVHQIDLYTQDYNIAAQRLYLKFGFSRIGTTWHYFVPFKTLTPKSGQFQIQPIRKNEIDQVAKLFANTMSTTLIHFWIESTDHHVYILKTPDGGIVGACRITPSFPGCHPFELKSLEGLDDFLHGLRTLIPAEYDYLRITFTDNPSLASLLADRDCKLHHRLHRMRGHPER